MPMVDFGTFILQVYLFVLRPIYENVLHPVFQYVLRPIFLGIIWVFRCISWLYGSRYTVMVQGLLCYWRAFLYFERSSLWKKLVDGKHHDKSYFIPLFWTMNGFFVIFIILLVLAATLAGEDNMRRVFNIQGQVGLKFYRLGKSTWELSIFSLMVYLGDHVADKSVAELNIASCFGCAYLSIISFFKLCHVANDLGFADGVFCVALSTFTHYCKSDELRIAGIFICWLLVLYKNVLLTDCCRRCSEPARDGGGGSGGGGDGGGRGDGGGGDGGGRGDGGGGGRDGCGDGGGGGGGGGGGDRVRYRGRSGEVIVPVDNQDEVFMSARSSTSARTGPWY